jgi:hypothetical protein
MSMELRERDLGQLLAHILEVATEQFGRLFLLQLVVGLPLLVTQLVLKPGSGLEDLRLDTPPEELLPIVATFYGELGLLALLTAVTYPIEQATAALLVRQLVDGERPDLLACLRGALRLFPRCLLLTVTLGVITTLGSMCCIAPGVIFWTWFMVVTPVLVLEGGPWSAAFGRSRALVGGINPARGGRFWEALAVYLLAAFAPAMVLTPLVMGLSLVPSPAAQALIGHFAMITLGVIPLTAPSVLYYHLRVVREAHDVDRLADLVDAIGATAPAPPKA